MQLLFSCVLVYILTDNLKYYVHCMNYRTVMLQVKVLSYQFFWQNKMFAVRNLEMTYQMSLLFMPCVTHVSLRPNFDILRKEIRLRVP